MDRGLRTDRRVPAGERAGRRERGAVAVELALLLPVLVLLIFGIVQFGQAYNAKVSLTGAVREGARALALGSGDPTEVTKAAAPSLDPTAITVTTSDDPCLPDTQATVTATYPFTYDIPFLGSATLTITAEGVMRCGL